MLELRDYQRRSLEALDAAWARGEDDGLVVLPTGAGKSLVIAALAAEALARAPDSRVAIVTHSRELVAQDHAALLRYWPEAPAGVYSAGLDRRDADAPVLVCGVQSVAADLARIGPRDLLIVDEAHLIPRAADTRYGRLLAGLRHLRPAMRVAGFTATPYRLDSGRLDEGPGRLFGRITFEVNVGDLIHRGHLSPLVCKATMTALDVAGVPLRGGDYAPGALEAAVNRDEVTAAAVAEMAAYGRERRAWLAFCAGVAHAEAVRDAVRAAGFPAEAVSGETPKRERDRILRAFRAGKLRCLTSVGVLSTGFDAPEVDLVALLRPTRSTGLYVQQVGRALRRAPGKRDALVLDYAGLVRMHGPVDAVTARTAAAVRAREGEARAKPCPGCGALIPLNASFCEGCWVEPDAEAPHGAEAEEGAPILSDGLVAALRAGWNPVDAWRLEDEAGALDIVFACEGGPVRVRVHPEGSGLARQAMVRWWRGLGGGPDAPLTAAEAVARGDELARPAAVRVRAARLSEEVACRWPDGRTFAETRRAA